MNIAMIGAGYVGLTTGACLASLGHRVSIFDIDVRRTAQLRQGQVPIYEPGLAEMIEAGVANGGLRFHDDLAKAVENTAAVFIAVGTPSRPDGSIDLSHVEAAARAVAPLLRGGAVIVVKSTVAAGTCKRIRELIAEERQALDIHVASNPEFLREGSAISDFLEPERVVFGFDDPASGEVLDRIYRPLASRTTIVRTSCVNAELTKHVANAFLAMKIEFVNQVADLCEKIGADVTSVSRGIGLDSRIGSSFLTAGPGFGGSCFPKDTRAYARLARAHGVGQSLVETVISGNQARRVALADRILAEAALVPGDTVAVLGLAFKANTDDTRESAALAIVPRLAERGVRVRLHDPKAPMADELRHERVTWSASPYAAADGAQAVVMLTEWDEYRDLKIGHLKRVMSGNHLFDFRNLYAAEDVTGAGLVHHSIGRPAQRPRELGAVPAHARIQPRAAAGRRLRTA
ncbi:MAG: UDP-glucose/GDP-mannose dehydrogenase family protein [Rhizobiaceae bacterium]|nr:UDP-glucose/GDP-mannose dehydrogenase family protein [Rhizobiaceae bacterium]MCV0407479.1 UDP-glucose/GDP-mannose dehydrogenase family protein [Rhizobiaceae bacterium]